MGELVDGRRVGSLRVVTNAKREEVEPQLALDPDGFEDHAEPPCRLGKIDLEALREGRAVLAFSLAMTELIPWRSLLLITAAGALRDLNTRCCGALQVLVER